MIFDLLVAAAALLQLRRRLMRARAPGTSQPPPGRHGLIGPFSGRQLGAVLRDRRRCARSASSPSPGRSARPPAPGPPTRGRPPFLVGPATGPATGPAWRPSSWAPRADGTPWPLTDLDGKPGPPRRPPRQGRLAQLLGELVPALPGRDTDPARHLRHVQGPRARARRDRVQETTRPTSGRTPPSTGSTTRSRPTCRPTSGASTAATGCRPMCSSTPTVGSAGSSPVRSAPSRRRRRWRRSCRRRRPAPRARRRVPDRQRGSNA